MDKHKDIINRVGELLQKPLSKKGLEDLDAIRFDLGKARVDAMQLLYEKRKQMLWPKDADRSLTELDRNTRLNGDVAPLERDYQFLNRLETLVDARIDLAKRFLSK